MYLSDVVTPIKEAFEASVKKHSDTGSCVMGYKLKANGRQVCPQPFQGSSGCYNVYEDMKKVLIELGYDEQRITVDYGVMD